MVAKSNMIIYFDVETQKCLIMFISGRLNNNSVVAMTHNPLGGCNIIVSFDD